MTTVEIVRGNDAPLSKTFLSNICAYFRDFLDTDFHRQRMPKRSISLKDQRGNLTGISVGKYPELSAALWAALSKQIDASARFSITIPRGKYRGRVTKALGDIITKHIAALSDDALKAVGDRAKAAAREMLPELRNDPERYVAAAVQVLRNDLVRTAVSPLLVKLETFFEGQGGDSYEASYDVEDELGARLVADVEGPIGAALATANVDDKFAEFDAVVDDVIEPATVRRRLMNYFDTFATTDFFEDLHQLGSTLKLRENFETYLYVCELKHNRVSYPLFYLPIQVELENGQFRISADPQIYINKKALDYAAQETARDLGRPIPLIVPERILYLQEGDSFAGAMQRELDSWCNTLALRPPFDLTKPNDQRSQRSQIVMTNAVHFAAFDKADEALLNDYEALLGLLKSGGDAVADFQAIVFDFLSSDPVSVTAFVEQDWSSKPIQDRLVYQSPVPLNEEQRKIITALHQNDSRFVAIEGPPGTGKSHTITAIVFEAILKGQSVLVLSDKTEALDVVESKLTEVLNSVRTDDDFQNPILRLGRSGNSYGRILASQSIEAIRVHCRASAAAQPRLTRQIAEDEKGLANRIRLAAEHGGTIDLNEVAEFHSREASIKWDVPDIDARLHDEVQLSALTGAYDISSFVNANSAQVLRILTAAHAGRVSLDHLEAFLKLQNAYAALGFPDEEAREAMRFFATFRHDQLENLHGLIADYQATRFPVFGFLFSGRRAREIDAKLGRELSPINTLNAYRQVDRLESAYGAFASLSARLSQHGVPDGHHAIAFQMAIEGMPPDPALPAKYLPIVSKIRDAVAKCPDVNTSLGLDPTDLGKWATESEHETKATLRRLMPLAVSYEALRRKFDEIPTFDYAGEKARLQSLHAQRLTHKIDEQVIDFADNHRNLARSIRDTIRKRQQFPIDNFGALKKAFPCVIAGIRDYAEYVPLQKGLFDIVIIDEASQVSIAQALPALIRAKKLVVLGDKKQFSNVKTANASVETNNQYTNAIIDELRKEVSLDPVTLNRVKLFNIKTSVLEFVERIASYHAMLKKHFRGYPELISFSSRFFYNGQLQAVKIRGVPIDDVIRFTQVPDDGRIEVRKNINSPELEAILSELQELAQLEEPPSVGIITPFNEQQSHIVQSIAKLNNAEDLQKALNLKVMTFDTCQGEERDIIMYSMVASPRSDRLSYIFPKSLEEADEVDHVLRLQRLNVGFSRAKEAIHIFHTLPLDEIRGAIGQALRHFKAQLDRAIAGPSREDTDPASPMEAHVLEWLEQTSFRQRMGENMEILPQFNLGAYLRQLDPSYRHPSYRVDFLINLIAPARPISIIVEYDGFKEHFTKLDEIDAGNYGEYYRPEDLERQKILEGYGYRFLRINRFNIGQDPVKTLDERLTRLAKDALKDEQTHEIVAELIETTNGLASGQMKICSSCGQVKGLNDFKDATLRGGIGRKCVACKKNDAEEKAATTAAARSSPATPGRAPLRTWRRGRRRRW
jgi:hypothetical protein